MTTFTVTPSRYNPQIVYVQINGKPLEIVPVEQIDWRREELIKSGNQYVEAA